MNKAGKSMLIIFPTDHYPPELVQPCKQTLNLPAPLVSSNLASILGSRSNAISRVPSDQFNAIDGKPFIERITVIGAIPDKSVLMK